VMEREESFMRGSPSKSTGRGERREGDGVVGKETGKRRNADDGEEEMEVDELDED